MEFPSLSTRPGVLFDFAEAGCVCATGTRSWRMIDGTFRHLLLDLVTFKNITTFPKGDQTTFSRDKSGPGFLGYSCWRDQVPRVMDVRLDFHVAFSFCFLC